MAVFLVVLRIICNFRINKPEQDFPAMREASIFKHLRDRGVLYGCADRPRAYFQEPAYLAGE